MCIRDSKATAPPAGGASGEATSAGGAVALASGDRLAAAAACWPRAAALATDAALADGEDAFALPCPASAWERFGAMAHTSTLRAWVLGA